MERDTNQMSQNVALCRSGCGFYGSPGTDGLCSKCYKDALKRKQSTQPAGGASISGGRTTPTSSGKSEELAMFKLVKPSTTVSPASNSPNTETLNSSIINEEVLSMVASPSVPAATISLQEIKSKEEPLEAPEAAGAAAKEPSPLEATPSTSNTADDDSQAKNAQKKKKNRCNICRRKVGLTGFECRCGGLFCSLHRYSNEHNCTFDYKELGAQEIRKNNPLVVGEKIQKI